MAAPTDSQVISDAREWIEADPDDETRAELTQLVDSAESGEADALADLHSRFDTRLTFGTAGLRGELGAGPNRMNRVVVSQTSAGLARFLLARETQPHVVVGYDGRKNSAVFARDTAEILAGAGVRVTVLPRLLPTPVLAFAVRHLDASGGVMVTASHNPARDNGYKLYLGGDSHGSQIVPPADAEVFGHIADVVADGSSALVRSTDYATADEAVVEAYIAETVAAFPLPAGDLRWVYTAMHGVGWETAARVFSGASAPEPAVVAEQLHPDSDFPTVAFPNPEEKGALNLAIATARDAHADLIIANDPDADRLAVVVRHDTGEWEQLRGNEVGLMLAHAVARRAAEAGRSGVLAASIVSTPGLAAVAEHYGFDHVETLTGFKWISRVPDLVYGFEEALGYLVDPEKVRDKDGISAALAALQIFLDQRSRGQSFTQYRTEFIEQFGWFGSEQISLRVTDLSEITKAMQRLRATTPTSVGGVAVVRHDDLSNGSETLPASDVVRLWLEGGGRIILRPSGTEPKLKIYIDVSITEGDAPTRRTVGESLLKRLTDSVGELIGPAN